MLQVRDQRGEWRTVIDDLGLPGGRPRTMAVDLSGKFLSASREVRILTNMCVYWDEIFAADGVADPGVKQAEAPLNEATLRVSGAFRGNVIHPDRLQPEGFIYAQARLSSSWIRQVHIPSSVGSELVSAIDDRYVILGAGDEVVLRFGADLPAPQPGYTRDYLLFVDGWAKENDANTAFGDHSGAAAISLDVELSTTAPGELSEHRRSRIYRRTVVGRRFR
ncbi:MAG: hypothetical protein R2724_05400 [Bryobacterales bacterium]